MTKASTKGTWTLGLGLICTLICGCSQRSLLVSTTPSGAQVYLDARAVGVTPLEIQFEYYGHREIIVRKKLMESVAREVELEAPWNETFPFDLVCAFFPFKDEHKVHIDMQEISMDKHQKALKELSNKFEKEFERKEP